MGKIVNLKDQTFGRLRVLDFYGKNCENRAMWWCECSCGTHLPVLGKTLVSGLTQSCGCLQKERATGANFKHGMAGGIKTVRTPEYSAYQNAKARCTNSNSENYGYYGGRGIKFLFKNFKQFFNELGLRPSDKHSVDRINNSGHYEPGNVRWATREEQQANTRTTLERKLENVR